MIKGIIHGFRRYFDFSGRDSRSLYWAFIISTHMVFILLLMPAVIAFMTELHDLLEELLSQALLPEVDPAYFLGYAAAYFIDYFADFAENHPFGFYSFALGILWVLLIIIPTVSATVRRLRDAGQNPWWVLPPCLSFVPVISIITSALSIVTLIYCCFGSAPPTGQSIPPTPEPGK